MEKQIKRETHIIDAKGLSLGRMATQIATILQGKNKTDYQPHLDAGDNVIVKNFDQVRLSGNKEKTKTHFHYSGYPGGMKHISLEKLFVKNPQKVLFLAVSRMLPKNKLQDRMMKRLKIEK